jgi:hypothetical protein
MVTKKASIAGEFFFCLRETFSCGAADRSCSGRGGGAGVPPMALTTVIGPVRPVGGWLRRKPLLQGNFFLSARLFPGSNEHTNGLVREYLPKGTNLSGYSQADLNKIANLLNTRPRKKLGFRTPEEVYLASLQPYAPPQGVALQH